MKQHIKRYQKYFFLLLLIPGLSTLAACSSLNSSCSDNWKVTGYYTPMENDYRGPDRMIMVRNVGMLSIKEDFLRKVKLEGWGKTRYGWYLGYYSKAWHKSENPLNTKGQPLKMGMVAVDSSLVPLSSRVRIPSLDQVLGKQIFVANDVGGGVKKKHIDIYTGEGIQAKKLAYNVTGKNTVCFK